MNMYRFLKFIIYCILIVFLVSLTGCSGNEKDPAKAIYLMPKSSGQLTKEELDKHPEVVSVTSFKELKKLASNNTAIWIDKASISLVDMQWLQKQADKKIPIALIGYNNAVYSFRENLPVYGIKGPLIDWSQKKLEPGYSVAVLKERTSTSTSVFLKGYDSAPDTKQILSITNMLLEGKFPEQVEE